MQSWLKYFFFLNISIELLFPLVILWFFPEWRNGFINTAIVHRIWTTNILIAFLLAYTFYIPTVIKVNIRRFPRVKHKATLVIAIPIIVEMLIITISELRGIEALFLASIHFFTALMLAMFFETVQRKRIRAIKVPPILAGMFLVAGLMTLISLQCIVFSSLLSSLNSFEMLFMVVVWTLGLAQIILMKVNQAGRKLYAAKGYRPNAAVIIMNELGEVLLCERANRPGTIQTVQGGIDPGETPEQAALRELTEEIGIWPSQYKLKAAMLSPKRYDWSKALQKKLAHTGFKGQEQYFFLVETSSDVEFDLSFHFREFRRVWWDTPEQLVKLSWSKKRPGIEAALKGFGLIERK